MKSTESLNTGRISSNERSDGSPEKLTDVENIGPEIAITSCMKGSEGTLTAWVEPSGALRMAVKGAGQRSIMSSGTISDDDLRAEAVVTEEGDGDYEIKNIAVRIGYQGMGYGSAMISFIKEYCRNRNGRTLYVGTGENPDTLRFYESNGFTRSHVIRDFFTDNYPHPIYEKGILLKDMIYLKQDLQQQQADRLS